MVYYDCQNVLGKRVEANFSIIAKICQLSTIKCGKNWAYQGRDWM